jgi:spermidine synthase
VETQIPHRDPVHRDFGKMAPMDRPLEELDWRDTPLGELILRRRRSVARPDTVVYEVKLDGAFLMSSLVRVSEEALAERALAALPGGDGGSVCVGGLGLGHTAAAALRHEGVQRVDVIELLRPVIDWHRQRLVPAADTLMDDPRCRMLEGDFFGLIQEPSEEAESTGLLPRYDAVLVDIDHAPESVLDPRHAAFYTKAGMERVRSRLAEGGVFALWSASEPSERFRALVESVFGWARNRAISFRNPNNGEREENWILLAKKS